MLAGTEAFSACIYATTGASAPASSSPAKQMKDVA